MYDEISYYYLSTGTNSNNDYIQYNFEATRKITGVVTTGRHESNQYVTRYKLIYLNMERNVWMDVTNEKDETHVSFSL